MTHCVTTKLRRARKVHRCTCGGRIQPGEQYLTHTELPGGDSGMADAAGHPVRLAECRGCAVRYGRDYLFTDSKDDWDV